MDEHWITEDNKEKSEVFLFLEEEIPWKWKTRLEAFS